MKTITIYTDGACSGNPGPGGWGTILQFGPHQKELSGYEAATTNNRMEIMAAIAGLKALKEPCDITLYSDSAYLINSFQRGWIDGWQRNGWQTAAKKPVENQDLWQELLRLAAPHTIHWKKVKGHADNAGNNRCDALARAAIETYRKSREGNA